jgi:hypothetical protein
MIGISTYFELKIKPVTIIIIPIVNKIIKNG